MPAPRTVAGGSRWGGPARAAARELGSAPSVPVFNHLFDSIGRPLDNFPRRYAVHHRLVQAPDNSRYERHLGARARRQPITSAPPAHVLPPASADAVPARLSQRQEMIGPHECQSKACPRQFLGLRPALNSGRPLGETATRLRVKVHGPLFLLVPSRELREYEICSQWERGCLGGGWSAPARVIWRRTQGVLGARRAPPRLLRPLRSPLSCGLPQYVDDAQED